MSRQTAIPEREEAVIISGLRKGSIIQLGSEPLVWSPEALDLLDRVVQAAQALATEVTATRKEVEALRDDVRAEVSQ